MQGNEDANPDYGYTNFDTWYSAYLSAFRMMTLGSWENLYQIVLRATMPAYVVFFALGIFIGSFYLINMIICIILMSSDELSRMQEVDMQR